MHVNNKDLATCEKCTPGMLCVLVDIVIALCSCSARCFEQNVGAND